MEFIYSWKDKKVKCSFVREKKALNISPNIR